MKEKHFEAERKFRVGVIDVFGGCVLAARWAKGGGWDSRGWSKGVILRAASKAK